MNLLASVFVLCLVAVQIVRSRPATKTIDEIMMDVLRGAERMYGAGRKTDDSGVVHDTAGLINPPGNPSLHLAELDIVITKDVTERVKRAAVGPWLEKDYYWTDGIVPFEIDPAIRSDHIDLIRAAMDEWEQYTCIRFVPHSTEPDYISFQSEISGCWTYIGRSGGKQPINLQFTRDEDPSCMWNSIITHEIGHVLGLGHEQSRPDRDEFIQIIWSNIIQGDIYFYQFSKLDGIVDSRNVPYDFRSNMHYGPTAFSWNGQPTIMTLDPAYQDVIGRSQKMSYRDFAVVNLMYRCASDCSIQCGYVHSENPNTEYYVDSECNSMCPQNDGVDVTSCPDDQESNSDQQIC